MGFLTRGLHAPAHCQLQVPHSLAGALHHHVEPLPCALHWLTFKCQVRAFLGLTRYYQHFARIFSSLVSPLSDCAEQHLCFPHLCHWQTALATMTSPPSSELVPHPGSAQRLYLLDVER